MVLDTRAEIDEQQVIDSLIAFTDREIMPIQAKVQHLIDDMRQFYDEEGLEVEAIRLAKKEARMKAAAAGFYAMFCPEEYGGSALVSLLGSPLSPLWAARPPAALFHPFLLYWRTARSVEICLSGIARFGLAASRLGGTGRRVRLVRARCWVGQLEHEDQGCSRWRPLGH